MLSVKPKTDDLDILPMEGRGGLLFDPSNPEQEVLQMILGDDDEVLGRMSNGADPSDFDLMARDRIYDTSNGTEGRAGDELDLMAEDAQSLLVNAPAVVESMPPMPEEYVHGEGTTVEDEDSLLELTPQPFSSPAESPLPIFQSALRKFQDTVAKPRVVRIDTEDTYGDYVSEKAVREIARRVAALENAMEEHDLSPFAHRAAFDAHNADPHAHERQEVLGAVEAFTSAQTPKDAAASMPQVPLDVPDFAKGKVTCYRDGDCVVVSIHFQAADGKGRIATMAARPTANVEELAGWALRSGMNPITILGALPDAVDVACGKRLLKDVAGAALKCQRRVDVVGMDGDGPLLLGCRGNGSAPIAAAMHLEQLAGAGHVQAKREVRKLASGKLGASVLSDARKRLAKGHEEKAKRKYGFVSRYADMALMLG